MKKLTFRYFPNPPNIETDQLEKKIFKYSLIIPLLFILIIWTTKIIEITFNLELFKLGVYPRHLKGLWGILFSPIIHADFKHLIGNSTSFLFLATALFYFYRKMALTIFTLNYILAGIFLWIGGRANWHIGASGVIYGLASFLFLSGIIRKDVRLLTISLIVTFLYGSFVWGLFPIIENISWDGHLMGSISGIILSLIFNKYGPPMPEYEWEENEDDNYEDFFNIEEQDTQENKKPPIVN